ncbi:MAG TPA: ferric reductase-like transmembrane domain-containing protein [Ktedonobacteraceae bacterium]
MTHLLLAGITVLLSLLTSVFIPREKQIGFLIVALGYLSLLLIFLSLLIGPLNLLRWRRNPVNIDLRRDIGIWAAITGCWHVLLVFRGSLPGGQLLQYFLQTGCCGYTPLVNVFGISNDLGLLATLLLIVLLVLSNTISLRVLKGKWWKRLQRLAYLLALLAVAHTIGYQYLNLRGPVLLALLLISLVVVLACQGFGIVLTLSRQRRG